MRRLTGYVMCPVAGQTPRGVFSAWFRSAHREPSTRESSSFVGVHRTRRRVFGDCKSGNSRSLFLAIAAAGPLINRVHGLNVGQKARQHPLSLGGVATTGEQEVLSAGGAATLVLFTVCPGGWTQPVDEIQPERTPALRRSCGRSGF